MPKWFEYKMFLCVYENAQKCESSSSYVKYIIVLFPINKNMSLNERRLSTVDMFQLGNAAIFSLSAEEYNNNIIY